MSVFDVMECGKNKADEKHQEIRIIVNALDQTEKSKTLNVVEEQIHLKKEKVKSLLFLMNVINKNDSRQFSILMEYDKNGIIEKYVSDKLKCFGGRYMDSSEKTIFKVATEAMTQMILDDQKAQELLDDILSQIYPQFYSKNNSESKTIYLIMDFIKKQTFKGEKVNDSKVCISLEEDTLAFFYYYVIWKVKKDKDNPLSIFLHDFIEQMEINTQQLLNERRTDTAFDWLSELLEIVPEEMDEDKIFVKYKESCYCQAAKWLYDTLETDGYININDEQAESYIEQQDYHDYLSYVFQKMIGMLQTPDDERNISAWDFGRNTLSAILNALSEIKWYPKMIGEKNVEVAFNVAALSTISSYAIISFEENEVNDLQRTNIIRKSSLKNPEQFVCSLFTSFVLNLISVDYKYKDYETFSVGKDMELLLKENSQEKNAQQALQEWQDSILELKDQEIERLKTNVWKLSEKQRDENKMMEKKIKPLEDENRTLQKENEKLKEELEALKRKKTELESMIEAYEETIGKQEEIIEKNEALTDEELRKQKILFVGGRYELIRTLKNIMENAKFVQIETDPVPDLTKTDRIIYFSNFINHATYNKVFDRAKVISVPYQFIHTQNYEQVWEILKKK